MRKTKKYLGLALATILAIGSLSGCKQGVDNNIPSQPGEKQNVQFSWWGNDERHKYTMDGMDAFGNLHPEINVYLSYGEWGGYESKNRIWMESGTEADVMQINYAWIDTYSKDGNGYYDLNELKDIIDLSGYDEKDLSFGMAGGKLNAIPIAMNMPSICFNQTMLDKYGLEAPKTWEDFFEIAKVLRKDGIYTIGAAKKHLVLMLVAYYEQTTGKNVFDDDGNLLLDKEGTAYILDFYMRLVNEEVLLPLDKFERNSFGEGKCATSLFWISDADNYCSVLEANGGTPVLGAYPTVENSKLSGLYIKPATMYALSSETDTPEAAATLLNFLLNDKQMILGQGTEKGVPVNEKAVEILKNDGKLDTYGYKAYEQMLLVKDKSNIMNPAMENEAFADTFKKATDAYVYNVSDRDKTIDELYKNLKEACAK